MFDSPSSRSGSRAAAARDLSPTSFNEDSSPERGSPVVRARLSDLDDGRGPTMGLGGVNGGRRCDLAIIAIVDQEDAAAIGRHGRFLSFGFLWARIAVLAGGWVKGASFLYRANLAQG